MSTWIRSTKFIAVSALVATLTAACGSSSSGSSSAASTSANSGSSAAASSTAAGSATVATGPPSGTVALTETGSTLLYPLFNLWDPAYHASVPTISVTAQGTGSGTGIAQAAAGTVDIGASDAYLSSGEVAKTPGLMNIPLAISAQQINYNLPGITEHLKLNGKVLSEIYQGLITKWNAPALKALNPTVSLPAMTIVPLHRSDGSGDTFLFSQYLSKSDPTGWGVKVGFGTTVSFPAVPGALGELGNGGMVSGCSKTPGCVAYIGISFLKQAAQAGLGEAMVGNASNQYLLPTSTTIHTEAASFAAKTPANEAISMIYGPASGAYPIINYEYAIVNQTQSSATTAQAIRAFLSWAIDPSHGNAPAFLNQVQFQPLPASVVKLSQAQIAKIGG